MNVIKKEYLYYYILLKSNICKNFYFPILFFFIDFTTFGVQRKDGLIIIFLFFLLLKIIKLKQNICVYYYFDLKIILYLFNKNS